jgi:Ca-activated chloride channel family protein
MLHRHRHVALITLTACLASLASACGSSDVDEGGGSGGGDYLSGEGVGTGNGDGDGDGDGDGPSASVGTGTGSGSGAGDSVPAPPPPIAPPDPEEDPACEDLDPTAPVVLYLSADDSNSMASPAEAREQIRMGMAPSNPIRTYEFLNYYDVDFPAPATGELGLFADARAAGEDGAFDLLLAVRAPDAPALRRPMTITFVADTSGSMDGTPMDRERAAMRAIAGQLSDGDIVNVLTWNDGNAVALEGRRVDGPNDSAVLSAIDQLSAGGGTDLEGGLAAGYELARQHFGAERLNRVVMISDGGANIGETSGDIIGEASDDADGEGIYLVGVGVGPIGAYSDELMDIVTDMGRGAYVYLDSTDEAERMFGARFDETMEVAARDVRVEVTLPWYFQMKRFYGEEYSENPEEVDPQHLAPGDVTVIMQTVAACSPDVVDGADPVRLRVEWQSPIERQPREAVIETTIGALLDQDHARLEQAAAIVAFAEALKTGAAAELDAALDSVRALDAADDPRFAEIEELLAGHPGRR